MIPSRPPSDDDLSLPKSHRTKRRTLSPLVAAKGERNVRRQRTMNTWLPLIIIAYLLAGLSLIPLAKRSPKYFGPAKELMEFLVFSVGIGGGFGMLFAILFAFLWPLALILGLLVPSLTLEHKLEAYTPEHHESADAAIGAEACCLSDLKPSGKIDLNGKQCDATCLKEFIPRGSIVRVIKQQGFNIVVERVV